MRRLHENRFAMVETTVAFLNKNSSVWQYTPAFVRAVADLRKTMEAIRSEFIKQQTSSICTAAAKVQSRDVLEDSVLEIADQLSALAAEQRDMQLATEVEMTRSALDKLTDDELEAVAKRVATLGGENLPTLADYLVTLGDITELFKLTDDFTQLKAAPRSAIVAHSTSSASLPELLVIASRILRERIDKLTTKLRNTHPEFVAGYRAARMIVDRRGRTITRALTHLMPATVTAA